jgi:ATP/maltotriose-dependent transcriptional regulator MalT
MSTDRSNEGNSTGHPDDLERQAITAYLAGDEEASQELWERGQREHLRAKDLERAARCVFWLVLDLFNRGEWARGGGWLARGLHLLESAPDSPAAGLLSVLVSRQSLKHGDIDAAANAARRGVDVACRSEDPDLAVFSRLAFAQVQARRGQFTEAAALFDEIMVAVTVDHVSPIAVGVVYCAVIDGCHALFDLGRAREWTTALSRWSSAQPTMVPFKGTCLVHRSEIMRFSGAWPEALAEAQRATDWSGDHKNSFKYPAGAASYELAEIHRLRGDWLAAEAAYRRASEHGQMPEPGLTLAQFAQGKLEPAAASIRRLLSERQPAVMRASILHAAVEILVATGDVPTARAAADELVRLTDRYYAPPSRALAAHGIGAVCLAEGDARAAVRGLRESWTLWQEMEAPYEAARVRVVLGQACRQLGDDAAAELELDAARRVFERLAAVPDVARVDALRQRSRGDRGHVLTARELQVIGLVAKGKTNRAIAQRLSISERTVDRHVSNILLKLELPSRSAATAYAYEHHLI